MDHDQIGAGTGDRTPRQGWPPLSASALVGFGGPRRGGELG